MVKSAILPDAQGDRIKDNLRLSANRVLLGGTFVSRHLFARQQNKEIP